jgi:hypothetical protein
VQPFLGRNYDERDEQPKAPDVIALSYAAWPGIFAGDPHVIGRQVELDQQQATVVGVMPEEFHAPAGTDLWRPAHFGLADWTKYRGDGVRFINVLARMKPGISLTMAQQDLGRVGEKLTQEFPDEDGIWRFDDESLRDHLYGNLRPALLVLLSASGLLLLIACVNVANLLLSRATSREREVALRQALGASGNRIMLQFLIESTMLLLIGGCIGLGAGSMARTTSRAERCGGPISRGPPSVEPMKPLKAGENAFAGVPILRVETLDRVKVYLDNPEAKTNSNAAETWLLLRASGTEPLMRISSESYLEGVGGEAAGSQKAVCSAWFLIEAEQVAARIAEVRDQLGGIKAKRLDDLAAKGFNLRDCLANVADHDGDDKAWMGRGCLPGVERAAYFSDGVIERRRPVAARADVPAEDFMVELGRARRIAGGELDVADLSVLGCGHHGFS